MKTGIKAAHFYWNAPRKVRNLQDIASSRRFHPHNPLKSFNSLRCCSGRIKVHFCCHILASLAPKIPSHIEEVYTPAVLKL